MDRNYTYLDTHSLYHEGIAVMLAHDGLEIIGSISPELRRVLMSTFVETILLDGDILNIVSDILTVAQIIKTNPYAIERYLTS